MSADTKRIAELELAGDKWILAHCGESDMFALQVQSEEER